MYGVVIYLVAEDFHLAVRAVVGRRLRITLECVDLNVQR